MTPYEQPGRPTDQPMQSNRPAGGADRIPPGGGQQGAVQQMPPVSEMSVSTPTVRWITIDHPRDQVTLGEDDYVLQSVFNHQRDAWEVLVLVQPRESDEEEEE